jgi:hypothetical protein
MKISIFALKIKVLSVLFYFIYCPLFAQTYSLNQITCPTNSNLFAVWAFDNNNVFAVGANGTLLKYDGSNCQQITTPTTNGLGKISGSSASDVWAIGDYGVVLHYDGTVASLVDIGVATSLRSLIVFGANDLDICGENGVFGHYNGSTFTPLVTGYASVDFIGMFGVNSNDIYLLGQDNYSPWTYRIYHYNGSGLTQLRSDPSSTDFHGIIWSADNNKFYLPGASYYCFDKSANTLTATSSGGGRALFGFSANDILGSDENYNIIEYNGASWTTVVSGAPIFNAIYSPNKNRANVYLVGNNGKFYKLNLTIGIKENDIAGDFSVYPNPTAGKAIINLPFISETGATVEIYDCLGQKVSTLFSETAGNGRKIEFDGSALEPGIYFIKVNAGHRSFSQKLLIRKN